MKRHVTGDPDVVHDDPDPAQCICQHPKPAEDDPDVIDRPVTTDE